MTSLDCPETGWASNLLFMDVLLGEKRKHILPVNSLSFAWRIIYTRKRVMLHRDCTRITHEYFA